MSQSGTLRALGLCFMDLVDHIENEYVIITRYKLKLQKSIQIMAMIKINNQQHRVQIMKQNSLQQYWHRIKTLDETEFHNYLTKSNILSKQTNDMIIPQIASQLPSDQIIKTICTIINKDKFSMDQLKEFGIMMSQHSQEFLKLYKIMPPLSTAISLAVLRFMKNLNENQDKSTSATFSILIEGIIAQQKILSDTYVYQLFLGLVYGECLHNLKNELTQLITYFPKFVVRLELVEKYTKNGQLEYHTIRSLLEIGSYILSWTSNKKNANNSQVVQRNITDQTGQQTQNKIISKNVIDRFCDILTKYGMVDEKFKNILMQSITEAFEKSIETQFVVEQFKAVVNLLNTRVFEGFDQFVFDQLIKIKKYVNSKNATYFAKMIANLTSKKSKQFLKENQYYLLKFGINEQLKILLFSLYYDLSFVNKNCDPQILNLLILWNVEIGLIPAQRFIPQILRAGIQKIYITTEFQIHSFKSAVGYEIIKKMAELKCKQLTEAKNLATTSLINYEIFSQNADIYGIYAKVFIHFLTNVDQNKFQTSPPQTIIFSQTVDTIKKIRQLTLGIFSKAMKNSIHNLNFLRPFSLLNSLIDTIKPTQINKQQIICYYFKSIKSLTEEELVQFTNYLLLVFKICKNAYCCFLIVACCLQLSQKEKYKHHCQNTLQLLIKFTAIQRFAKINSYSGQTLKILLLLSYALDQKIKVETLRLITSWCSLYNKTDIQAIMYQFDRNLFQQFLSNNNIKFPSFSHQKFIFHTLQILNSILKQPPNPISIFMSHNHNHINFIPISHANQKNSISINFRALINPRLCCNSLIQIYGSSRTQSGNQIKHRIIFKNKKIILYNRMTKQVIATTEEFPDELYFSPLQFTILISNQRLSILINKREFASKEYDYLVDSIRFDMHGDLMISQFKWKRFQNQQKSLQLKQSFQIFPSDVQIKISKLAYHEIRSFQSKLDLVYFCLYLSELGRINYSKICFSQYYKMCSQLILNCQSSIKDEFSSQQFACIRKLFKNLLKWTDTSYKIYIPVLPAPSLKTQTKKFYQFLLATVINQRFLNQTNQQSRLILLKYLQQLIFNKQYNFKQAVQNKHVKIFGNISKLLIKLEGQLAQKYSQLIRKIIITHQTNQNLLKKISMLFYLSQSNNSKLLKGLFDDILNKIFSNLGKQQTQGNYHLQVIGKYILSETKNLQLIFLITNADVKLKILDFMIEDQQLSAKCHSIFQDLTEAELSQMSDWLIVFSKKLIFEFFDQKKQTKHNLLNMMFLLKQITKIFDLLYDPAQSQQIITILNSFIKKSIKILNQNTKPQIIAQISNFISLPNLINLISKKIFKLRNQDIKDPNKQIFLNCYFNVLFLQMPKLIILESLEYFRTKVDNPYDCTFYMLELQCIYMLPQKSLSAFLQYLIQILFMVEQEQQKQELETIGLCVHQFIQKIIKNYSKVSQIKSPLLYSYPKMQKKLDFNDSALIKKVVTEVKQTRKFQLKGGIYFKLICIVFHLFQILPIVDLSNYIVFFLQKLCEKKQNTAVYRAVNDFIQVSTATKNRSPMDMTIRDAHQQHLKYFHEEDEEMVQLKLLPKTPLRKSKQKIDIDNDLTPYFVDFFFMRMCLYLEKNCTINNDPNSFNKNYSDLTIKYLKMFEHIWDEMNQKNVESSIVYENVRDLRKLIQDDEYLTVSDVMNSPQAHYRRFSNDEEGQVSQNLGFIGLNNSGVDNQFLTPPKIPRRRNTLVMDFMAGKRNKKKLFQNIQSDYINWSEQGKRSKIHRYFRDQSKEIFFFELLHQLYVITSFSNSSQIIASKSKRFSLFLKDQQQLFNEEEKQIQKIWRSKIIEIRRVYPFTSVNVPQLKLKCHSFPNGTFPFLSEMKHQRPVTQQPQQLQALSPDLVSTLLNIPNQQQSGSPNNYRTQTVVCVANVEDDLKKDNFCQISFRKGVYFCQWQMQEKSVIFRSKQKKTADTKENKILLKYGSPLSNILAVQGKKIQLKITDILEIFYRKYNQIRNNSIQFFLKNGASVYIIFYTEQRANQFLQKCKKKYMRFRQIKIVQNYVKSFQSQNFTEKWVIGQLSNFQYLMLINKYSGRTFCDLNQYYVFPWILQDYKSKYLDISNPKIYRDLKKPIGALNQKKLEKYLQKLSNHSFQNGKPYLYGSHYSTSLFIYYYLVRLEPFTTLHKDMQSGDFDAPDRLFSSLQQMWQCLMSQSSTSDIKQAIPQFYYLPSFLKNVNRLNLGEKQSGISVQNVQLPPWASSPTNFIQKMRICLQSDYVSSNLNYWIDLIFGKDQNSLQKNNVFHPLSYVDSAHPENITDIQNLDAIISQIAFFGQNPCVLFTKQHPKKKFRMSSINAPSGVSLYGSTDLSMIPRDVTDKISKMQEQNLQMMNYVSYMAFKTKTKIQLKIASISKNAVVREIDLDMDNTVHSLMRTIQKVDSANLKRLLSQNSIQLPQQKIGVSTQVSESDITFSIGYKDCSEIVKSIKLAYIFQHIRFNDIVLVVYGSSGLRIYNWTEQIIWDFSNQLGEISECFLEPGLIFFTTSTGKLFVYDFFDGVKQLLFQYVKPTYSLNMLVYPENRVVTKKNQNTYKFLLVGDKRKIMLLQYTHRVGKNFMFK